MNLYQYTSKDWDEVTTEHERNFLSCSGVSRNIEKKWNRIKKYGYPKRCPAIKNIQSLIFFEI